MKKRLLVTTFHLVITLIVSFSTSSSAEIKTDEVSYTDAGGKANGYLARPVVDGKLPTIILIHEWWGLNDDIRSKARKFAELGYVALAVDLYHGKSTTERSEAGKLAGGVRANMNVAQQNLKDAVAMLKKSPHVDPDRMAAIGWCFGGGWSYQMAKNNLGVKASVIYYGRFNPKDDLKKMRAEIIGHFAEEDRGISVDNVKEFQATLKTLNGEHEIYIYPNTTHGFASREGANPNFKKQEADTAWKRTLAFLDKHVVGDSSKGGQGTKMKVAAGSQTENFFNIPAPAEGRPESMPFLLYTPKDYEPSKSYPLLLFLHGLGESGDGDFKKLAIHGPPKHINNDEHFPFIVVSPQSPMPGGSMEEIIASWQTSELMALLDEVEMQLSIDKQRVYVSGLSMGGFGTWRLVANHPERFAAAVPVCGGGKPEWANKLKTVPIWAFHGAKDNVVPMKLSKEMVDAIQIVGGDVKLTVYPEAGHDSWSRTYANAEVYEWLLRHQRN